MSVVIDEEIKRWTARQKSALVLEILQGKTTVAEASRQFDLQPSEINIVPIDLGKRWQNRVGESDNGESRDECLNSEGSRPPEHNRERPHSGVGCLTLWEFIETLPEAASEEAILN